MDKAPTAAPLSSHPAFKWAVAAWFAALCGLGLLGILINSPAVYRAIAQTIGLAEVLPEIAMVPALALIAALFGFLLGLVIAARVSAVSEPEGDVEDAAAPREQPTVWLASENESTEAPSRSRRLFNPREDLDDEGIAAPTAPDAVDTLDLPPPGSFPDDQPIGMATSALMDEWREETGFAEPALSDELGDELEVSYSDNGREPDDIGPPAEPEHGEERDEWSPQEGEAEESELGTVPLVEPEPPADTPKPRELSTTGRPLGDMSLPELTDRLREALSASREARQAAVAADEDQVVTFLRREAARTEPSEDRNADPQAVLRNALDKLSRVSNPK